MSPIKAEMRPYLKGVLAEFPLTQETFDQYIKDKRILRVRYTKQAGVLDFQVDGRQHILIYDKKCGGLRSFLVEEFLDADNKFVGGIFNEMEVVEQDGLIDLKLITSKGVIAVLISSSEGDIRLTGRVEK